MPKPLETQNKWQIVASVLASLSWIPISVAAVLAHRPLHIETLPVALLWSIGIALQWGAGIAHGVHYFRKGDSGSQTPTVTSVGETQARGE
jgi:hypothetical protein